MVIAWTTSKITISPESANAQILAIADFEKKYYEPIYMPLYMI